MDGAWGSITPQAVIHMALYSERWNTPEETLLRLEEGRVTDVPDPEKNERMLIREIEADIFLSEESAASLVKWLNTQIGKLRELRQLQEREEEK